MLDFVKKGLLSAAQATISEVACPFCHHKFQPFAGRKIEAFSELNNFTCPKCAKTFTYTDSTNEKKAAEINPEGPFNQPGGSKIERRPVSSTELLFYIPASGRWGGMLFFSIVWNLISWTIFLAFIFAKGHTEGDGPPILLVSLFPLAGIGLGYTAIRTRFATHLLFLGPEFVRLQRSLFRRKNFDLPTAEIVHVKKAEFYQRNYQPVYGIEIGAGKRKIRFGSVLTEMEKNWLCWEIRTFLRAQGAKV